jgi:hypothetical protein
VLPGHGETPYAVVGVAGGAVDVATTLAALSLVWASGDSYDPPEVLLKGFLVGTVVSLSLAQVSMLLGLAGRGGSVTWLLTATLGLVGILAVLLTGVILSEADADGVWRLIGVVAILDVLGTVVTVAIAKFGSGGSHGPRALELTGGLAIAVADRARAEGRPAIAVLEEAVERYLRG